MTERSKQINDRELAERLQRSVNKLRRKIDAVAERDIRQEMDACLTRVYLLTLPSEETKHD